jgi:hypothetical protein
MIRTRTLLTTAAIALAGVVAAPAAAFASTPNDTTSPVSGSTAVRFDTAKARCTGAVTRRVADLGSLASRAASSGPLTDAHTATTSAFLTEASSGLGALLPQVQAASDRTTLKALCDQVVPAYRVYVLRTPQVKLAISLDASAARVVQLTEAASAIEARLPSAKNPEKAAAALAAMKAAIAAAQAALAGQADALLLVTPADYNTNTGVLAPFRSANSTAERQVAKAATAGAKATRAIVRR